MSTFGGIRSAVSGLQAQQIEIETATNNVTNAATPGYHRQTVSLTEGPPSAIPGLVSTAPNQIGTGVLATSVQRTIDPFLANSLNLQLSGQGAANVQQDTTSHVQSIFNSLGVSGVGGLLDKFWNAWGDVANSPSDLGVRASLTTQAQTLASTIQQDYGQLISLRQNLDQQFGQQVSAVNSLTSQIAALNGQIARIQASGQQANNLLDQQGSLINQLAGYVQIGVANQPNGGVRVVLNGTPLVDGTTATTLATTQDATGLQQITAPDGKILMASGGSLAGLQTMRDQEIPDRMAALDQWAQRLMHAVNAVHSGQDPSTGATIANVYDLVTPGTPVQRSFFSGTGAADIAVNSALVQNPGLIAASRTSNGSGDGSNAQAIAALQQDALAGGTASGGPTLNGQLQTLATTIGNSASSAQAAASDQTLMVQHLQQLDQQTGGVSLNEEAANLQVYQLAYQAASKALTVLDAMLDQLINKTGVG